MPDPRATVLPQSLGPSQYLPVGGAQITILGGSVMGACWASPGAAAAVRPQTQVGGLRVGPGLLGQDTRGGLLGLCPSSFFWPLKCHVL